jgi:hypothetical protein
MLKKKSKPSASQVFTWSIAVTGMLVGASLPDDGFAAIVGSGKEAIVGSGKEAIVGSGKEAIVGSGTEAIVGSGKEAIVGSGKEAIVGSGKEAIVGSGKEAIVGSSKEAIVGSGKEAIVGSGTEQDPVFSTLLSGPVTEVEYVQSTVTVLGQTVHILDSTYLNVGGVEHLQVGDWVTVSGIEGSGDVYASTLSIESSTFINGVSTVFVAGTVSDVDSERGQARIGRALVDLSTLSHAERSLVSDGSYIEVTGILPQFGERITGRSIE